MVAAFGGRCAYCGIVDDPVIYDFHHLSENEKDFQVSSRVINWEKAVSEAKKCIMLCAHCHRKIHGGLIEVDLTRVQKFDESLIPEDLLESSGGKKFSTTRVFVDWSAIDLKELFDRYSGNINQMANHVGVSWKCMKQHVVAAKITGR